jgi:hypothetical protein
MCVVYLDEYREKAIANDILVSFGLVSRLWYAIGSKVGDQKNKLKPIFNINPAGKVGCIYVDR